MKRTLALLMSLTLFAPYASAEKPISVYIDGKQQIYSQPPVLQNGSTLVPLRGIFESLGADVKWESSTQTVTAVKDSTTVILKIGSTQPTVNGTVKPISTPAQIINDSTMVPLRFVSEAIGSQVNWNSHAQSVEINTNNPAQQFPKLDVENVRNGFLTIYTNAIVDFDQNPRSPEIKSYDNKYEESFYLYMYGKYSNVGNNFVQLDVLTSLTPEYADTLKKELKHMEVQSYNGNTYVNLVNIIQFYRSKNLFVNYRPFEGFVTFDISETSKY